MGEVSIKDIYELLSKTEEKNEEALKELKEDFKTQTSLIIGHLTSLNGKVASHEKTINIWRGMKEAEEHGENKANSKTSHLLTKIGLIMTFIFSCIAMLNSFGIF